MRFDVTILGSSSATPIYNRNPTSQALNINERFYLIDCGEGTQQQMLRFDVKPGKIDHIFISHLHGDHYLGLIGLLSSMHLNGRKKPMHIFGPPDLKKIIDINLECSWTKLNYELIFHPLKNTETEVIFENKDIIVQTIILNHRIPCTGFLFSQKKNLLKLNATQLEHYQVGRNQFLKLKQGEDFVNENGERVPNSVLTIKPEDPKSYAYCSDTLAGEAYLPQIEDVDLLYHEATFMHDLLARAQETYHTTALQAGEIAFKTGVKKLLIGHFSARYKTLDGLLEEARSVFKETDLAIEGKVFTI
ncbi:ribonuclease Z [Mucilaginibacter arboris]|uniref:Ribonuclease Z n=1 Tax=Mucilaginibacter arboris TaxID=2682090 RepID=A0A7K1SXF3_9SPHI|nr:ribonuclease Z [Mucilaginibacter arboris]MVN21983.1 ribonuclease Z [Mucilaginibacter arboris]